MKSKLKIEISTDNAAFQDGNKRHEIARIRAVIMDKIKRGQTEGRCMDINGNCVGAWKI